MNSRLLLLLAGLAIYSGLSAQTDTVPPQLVCKAQLAPSLNFCFPLTVPAVYFLDSVSDNTTATADLELGVRRVCLGDGFPENQNQLTLWVSDLWVAQAAEVWALDQAGNTSSCTVIFWVNEPTGSCDPSLYAAALTPDTNMINGVSIDLLGTHCLLDTLQMNGMTHSTLPGYASWGQFGTFAPTGYTITATASKSSNPLNGVSTLDLALIQKHLLGLDPLDSPYKIIAADANQDGKVTSFDLLILKQLLLGVTTELPNGHSWQFLPYDYVFPDPANPFSPPFPKRIEVPNTTEPALDSFLFKGIKSGM